MDSNKNHQNQNNSVYDAESIKVLKGLEGVRKRPAMYIGDTGENGLHHLIFEVIDNSIDESLAGFCDKIDIIINSDNSVEIIDNGRGIPIGKHPEYDKYTPEVILEHLHAGGKFDSKAYRISGGLHGVGLSVVCALTEKLIVEVKREGKLYRQNFSKGVSVSEPEIINLPENEVNITETKISFYPDNEIFDFNPEDDIWNITKISNRVRELAFLNPNTKFSILNENIEEPIEYYFKGGLIDFVSFLNKNKKLLIPTPIYFKKAFVKKKESGTEEILVEVAMQYNQSYGTNILTFANTINTKEGGTHLTGFKGALTRVMNSYLENEQFKKFKGMILSGEDVREGLTAILSIMLPDPQFESQTKIKLGNPEIRQIVSRIVSNELEKHLEENPETAKSIIYKALEAKKARDAAQSAKQLIRRKSALDSIRLPGKLADCSSSESEKCELFIVEGSSAGGSAKQGRDREFQAILPLRGKILNVEKSRIHKILNNKEIQAMIKTIDAGIEGIDDEPFDLTKLRYHKIIIMCDADIDGSHIETLLLTFFFRYMRPLIENGHLYVALPPLYKINYKKFKKYAFNDKERDNIVKDLMEKYKIKIENKGSIKIQRYKGLGEMNPPELYETTMNKDNRSLLRVKIEDLIETDQIFSQLMGDDVQPRKKFIVDKYKDVKVLDI